MSNAQPVNIILIEDNEDHAILIQKALRDNGVVNDIRVLSTGEQALDYLLRRGAYADAATSPRPGLILLDIRLPGIDGFEVLKTIKQDADLKVIPVVMLTASARDNDIAAGYANGANSYVQKPVDFAKFLETVKKLRMYWLLVNELPRANP